MSPFKRGFVLAWIILCPFALLIIFGAVYCNDPIVDPNNKVIENDDDGTDDGFLEAHNITKNPEKWGRPG